MTTPVVVPRGTHVDDRYRTIELPSGELLIIPSDPVPDGDLFRDEVPLTAAFDPDQERGPDGKWVPAGGGGAQGLVDEWTSAGGAVAINRRMLEVGEALIGVSGSPLDIPNEVRRELKAGIATDLARAMTSPTLHMADAVDAKFGSEYRAAIENPDDYVVLVSGMGEGRWLPGIRTVDSITDEDRASFELAGDIAILRPDDPRADVAVREGVTSRLVTEWAGTANNQSEVALAIQRAAEAEFGIRHAEDWVMHDGLALRVEGNYRANGDVYRDFLRTQYNHTQGFLEGEGIEELTVVRGWHWDSSGQAPEWAIRNEPGTAEVELRPVSSWTVDARTARGFAAQSPVYAITHATVPRVRILSIPLTGIGSLPEKEVTVLGGRLDVAITMATPPSNPFAATNVRDQEAVATENEDWLRTMSWDLPATVEECARAGIDLARVARLPAGQAMPSELRVAAGIPALTAAFDPDQERGPDGKWIGDGDVPTGWRQEEPTDAEFVAVYRNENIKVSVTRAAAERVPIETQHEIMDRLATLRESDSTGYSLRVNIVNPSEMRSRGAAGETFTSPSRDEDFALVSVIQLNASTLEPSFQSMGSTVHQKMPGVSYHDYVVTHEYGHALQDSADHDRDDPKFERERVKIMKNTERPSAYGDIKLTNKHEAYAEAFADWRLSDQPGPLAVALAEHDGWGSR